MKDSNKEKSKDISVYVAGLVITLIVGAALRDYSVAGFLLSIPFMFFIYKIIGDN